MNQAEGVPEVEAGQGNKFKKAKKHQEASSSTKRRSNRLVAKKVNGRVENETDDRNEANKEEVH